MTFKMLSGRTVLRARWVVGNTAGRHVLVPNGQVVVDGNRIVHVGTGYSGPATQTFDFGNAIIGPGFIDLNALSDLDTALLGFDNQPEECHGRVWPRDYYEAGPIEMYTQEELAFQKRYAFANLLLNGITTAAPIASLFYRAWAETVPEFVAAAEAARNLGIRAYLSPAYASGHAVVDTGGGISLVFDERRGMEGLNDAVRFISSIEAADDGLVRGMLVPNRIETCTPDLLRETMAAAADLGCKVRLHACQGSFEYAAVMELRGNGPVEWLEELGVLGPQLLVPHATHVAPSRLIDRPGRDLALLVGSGVGIIHCPIVAARFGASMESFRRYRELGLTIAMGTDTGPPDMLRNMQLALLMGRVADASEISVRSEDVYDAATLGGASALGRDDLGKLEPGAMADLTVFNLDLCELGQVIDPIQTMLFAGHGGGFSHVMVNGQFSVFERRVRNFDLEDGRRAAQDQFDRLVALYPRRTLGHPPLGRIFTPSYAVEGATDAHVPWHAGAR